MADLGRKRKLSVKIVTGATVLAAIFLGGWMTFILRDFSQIFSQEVDKEWNQILVSMSNDIKGISKQTLNDVLVVAASPDLAEVTSLSKETTLKDFYEDEEVLELHRFFTTTIETKVHVTQMRLLDTQGQEIVRVDRRDGQAVILESEELQNKSTRDYVKATNNLGEGEVYISEMSLNREGNPPEIEIPYNPVVRYGVPLFDEEGERVGMFIMNVSVLETLASLRDLSEERANFYAFNKDGYFMVHPDKTRLWGSYQDLGTGFNFSQDFDKEIVDLVMSNETSSITKGEKSYFSKQVFLDNPFGDDTSLIILAEASHDDIFGTVHDFRNRSILNAVYIFVVLFFAFLFFVKYLLRQLTPLVDGAKEVSKGNFDVSFEAESSDEIGVLADAFNKMTVYLRDFYKNLQGQIKENTQGLSQKVKELEESRVAMLNVLEDIDLERKRSEVLEERLTLALEAATLGVWDWDLREGEIFWNKNMYEIYGVTKKGFSGKYKSWNTLFTPEDQEVMKDLIKKATEEVEPFDITVKILRKIDKSERYVRILASPRKNDQGEVVRLVGTSTDVTLEREVDKAKTEFVSLASHQLRTPLSSINWYTEMLLDEDAGKITKNQREYLEEIYAGNQRMVELVNSLLNVSRIELGTFTVEPTPTDIIEIAESVVKELKPQIKQKKQKLQTDYAKDIPTMNVDQKLFRIIFQNLLSNAVKYTPDKGEIILKVLQEKNKLVVQVKDTGYGIPEKQQEQIFTKLFRADNVQDMEGTGLGLYIVDAIVRDAGGEITFNSIENEGTTFEVTLPLSGMKEKKGSVGLS